uniref:Uncharacterized protein n=1 Tax=Manihot esculenta TaxID=3983 RepID=A0A2C9WMT8_MANES
MRLPVRTQFLYNYAMPIKLSYRKHIRSFFQFHNI